MKNQSQELRDHRKVVEVNPAVLWKQCEAGDPEAQAQVGILYFRGACNFPLDKQKAVEYWTKATDQGHWRAGLSLANCYILGDGVGEDPMKGVEIYRKLIDSGCIEANVGLGMLYMNGTGVAQDFKEAARLYKIAASTGNANAQNNLGHCYEGGHGVKRNLKKAHRLYTLAAAQDHTTAGHSLTRLNSQTNTCHMCHKEGGKGGSPLMVCAGCRKTFYCSRECQRADWPKHKSQCKEKSQAPYKPMDIWEGGVCHDKKY